MQPKWPSVPTWSIRPMAKWRMDLTEWPPIVPFRPDMERYPVHRRRSISIWVRTTTSTLYDATPTPKVIIDFQFKIYDVIVVFFCVLLLLFTSCSPLTIHDIHILTLHLMLTNILQERNQCTGNLVWWHRFQITQILIIVPIRRSTIHQRRIRHSIRELLAPTIVTTPWTSRVAITSTQLVHTRRWARWIFQLPMGCMVHPRHLRDARHRPPYPSIYLYLCRCLCKDTANSIPSTRRTDRLHWWRRRPNSPAPLWQRCGLSKPRVISFKQLPDMLKERITLLNPFILKTISAAYPIFKLYSICWTIISPSLLFSLRSIFSFCQAQTNRQKLTQPYTPTPFHFTKQIIRQKNTIIKEQGYLVYAT